MPELLKALLRRNTWHYNRGLQELQAIHAAFDSQLQVGACSFLVPFLFCVVEGLVGCGTYGRSQFTSIYLVLLPVFAHFAWFGPLHVVGMGFAMEGCMCRCRHDKL
jgi:hypothetical protein